MTPKNGLLSGVSAAIIAGSFFVYLSAANSDVNSRIAPPMIASDAQAGTAATLESELQIVDPKSNARLRCLRTGDGIYTFTVTGTSKRLSDSGQAPLLWVRPTNPAGDGYYLQRRPLGGIAPVDATGTWNGSGQIGSRLYPPRNGDTLDLVVTLVDAKSVDAIMNDEASAVKSQPVGRIVAKATDLTVSIKPGTDGSRQ